MIITKKTKPFPALLLAFICTLLAYKFIGYGSHTLGGKDFKIQDIKLNCKIDDRGRFELLIKDKDGNTYTPIIKTNDCSDMTKITSQASLLHITFDDRNNVYYHLAFDTGLFLDEKDSHANVSSSRILATIFLAFFFFMIFQALLKKFVISTE